MVAVGVDADPPEIEALREGLLDALVIQQPWEMGYQGVSQAIAALRGSRSRPLSVLAQSQLPPRQSTHPRWPGSSTKATACNAPESGAAMTGQPLITAPGSMVVRRDMVG